MRRRGLPRTPTIASSQHLGRPSYFAITTPHFHKRSHKRANHVVKKSITVYFKNHAVRRNVFAYLPSSKLCHIEVRPLPPAPHRKLMNRSDRIRPLRARRFETREVVTAHEPLPCPVHCFGIQPMRVVPRIVPFENRRHPTVMNHVAIPFPHSIVSGMKLLRRIFDGNNSDVARQQCVEATQQIFIAKPRLGRHPHDLSKRVDASIRASRGSHIYGFLR